MRCGWVIRRRAGSQRRLGVCRWMLNHGSALQPVVWKKTLHTPFGICTWSFKIHDCSSCKLFSTNWQYEIRPWKNGRSIIVSWHTNPVELHLHWDDRFISAKDSHAGGLLQIIVNNLFIYSGQYRGKWGDPFVVLSDYWDNLDLPFCFRTLKSPGHPLWWWAGSMAATGWKWIPVDWEVCSNVVDEGCRWGTILWGNLNIYSSIWISFVTSLPSIYFWPA